MSPRILRNTEAGLTLLELMIAVTIVGMIAAIAYGMMAQVIDGVELARGKAAEMRVREFLSRNLRRNLNGIYLQPWLSQQGPQYFFEGVDGEQGGGDADSLTFFTTTSVLGATAMPGDVKQVTIELVGGEGEEGEYDLSEQISEDGDSAYADSQKVLQVIETPVTGADIGAGDDDGLGFSNAISDNEASLVESPSWTVPVDSFNVQYYLYDNSTQDWVDEWHSDDYQRLPWAIRVSINFPRTEEERKAEQDAGIDAREDPDFVITIPLMTAGIGTITTPLDLQDFHPELVAQQAAEQRAAGGVVGGNTNQDTTDDDNDDGQTTTTTTTTTNNADDYDEGNQ